MQGNIILTLTIYLMLQYNTLIIILRKGGISMSIKVSLNNYRTVTDIQDVGKVRSMFLGIITDNINTRKLNQKNAAKILGIDQPKISHIKNGKISGFSLERLLKFLRVLGYEVNICINKR